MSTSTCRASPAAPTAFAARNSVLDRAAPESRDPVLSEAASAEPAAAWPEGWARKAWGSSLLESRVSATEAQSSPARVTARKIRCELSTGMLKREAARIPAPLARMLQGRSGDGHDKR